MARDRLAAIRAQQQQIYQRPSVPSPPLDRDAGRDTSADRWHELPRDFDPYAGDIGYGGRGPPPPLPYKRDEENARGDWAPDQAYESQATVPRRREEPDLERRRGTSRYGSISHSYTPPDFTSGAQYGLQVDPTRPPRQDFDPRTMTHGQQASPNPQYPAVPPIAAQHQPQRSQYTPVDPVRTRQRSLSGGRSTKDRGPRSQELQPQIPQGPPYISEPSPAHLQAQQPQQAGPHHQRTRSGGRNVGGVPYAMDKQPNYGSAEYYDEKNGSSTDFGDSASAEFEMRRRASEAQSSSVKKSPRGQTIRAGDVPFEDMGEFFSEISDLQQALREANGQIQRIQDVQMRLLAMPSSEDPQSQALTRDLHDLTGHSRSLYSSIKRRIHELAQGNANLRALIPAGQSVCNLTLQDVDVRQTQVDALKERFKNAIQRYAEMEQEHRAKNRAKMERQVKTVYPNLSAVEINEVVKKAETTGGEALFSQAVLHGARTYAARGALREVESRAAELARIEQTLAELAQLFNDMSTLVKAQDVQIVAIEHAAAETNADMEKGLEHTKAAVVSARNARKWRWWCFGIIVVILLIVLIVVITQVVVPLINRRNDNNRNNEAQTTAPPAALTPAQNTAPAAATTPTVASSAAVAAASRAVASGLQARATAEPIGRVRWARQI